MPKFAANLSTLFTEIPFLQRFEAAAKAGFRAVEFLFPYDYQLAELKQALTRHQLELVLFNTAPGDTAAGEWGVSAIPGREAEARRDIDRALEYALALESHQVHIMAGVVPKDADREAYCRTFIDNVRYAAERFARHDIRILLEALNPETKPDYLYSSQYQVLEMVKRIDRPGVFIQLDLYHAQLVDGNLSHLIVNYIGRYQHIQIASVPDRHEPDEGEVNFPWLFELLDSSGYQGWIGCEYFPRTTTLAGLGWLTAFN
ncbi:HPr family phosphocarrier protein [Erwinia amylovora]|uniref:HPr family phosphocarrier protein n=3 Tax=Erwinia amylovora TaxID=552 RepID=A0ABX7MLN2_ERWAM|nr:HPr family phosphocarrier protein [Erwinia amylovora]CDK14651.1 putative endonuclease [Erwinia amylovora LA635]CDK18019.1 putative endonuclease [Erwinia amylovora LA636]CDK21388.1 putative endonuclease [Erwinia amylovora LA637]ATZ10981.1 hydroxypyruvate isomerase [Erwinia amylovora]EKV53812.1 putative endonuclease [Erwinia amylovora ACW56400]